MIECKICQKQFDKANVMTNHVRTHGLEAREYYDIYIKSSNEGKCIICETPTRFVSISKGYVKTCSSSCAVKIQWKDQKRLEDHKFRFNPLISGGRPKGSKNKNPYPISEKVMSRFKTNPPPSWSGKFHTEETKDKMSNTRLAKFGTGEIKIPKPGKRGFYHKGRFRPKFPHKYRGDVRNIIYRSGWELKLFSYLDSHPNILEWSSEELRVPYLSPKDGKIHNYFPDVVIKVKRRDGTIETLMIEVKPSKETKPPKKSRNQKRMLEESVTYLVNQAKWEQAHKYCEAKGWTFRIFTEKDLGIKK